MLHLGIVKAGPITVRYWGKVVKNAKLNQDGTFSCGNKTFKSPSSFALDKLNISTIFKTFQHSLMILLKPH